MDAKKGKDAPLTVNVSDGQLMISIGVNTLAFAVASCDDFYQFDDADHTYFRKFAITDPDEFADDVSRELQREEEDGSSPLTALMDKVSRAAIDDGSLGVEYGQVILFDEKSPLEGWRNKSK